MARRSGGRSAPRPRAAAPVRNPPAQVNRAPPPAPVQGGGGSMFSGIGSTIAQGMAFGTGSSIAHRAVDAIAGPRTIQHETVASEASGAPLAATNSLGSSDACGNHSKAFQDCLNSSGSDISRCQFYMDMLAECKRNSGSMMRPIMDAADVELRQVLSKRTKPYVTPCDSESDCFDQADNYGAQPIHFFDMPSH